MEELFQRAYCLSMDLRGMVGVVFLFSLFVFEVGSGVGGEKLSYDFYQESCPEVEDTVRVAVQSFSFSDPSTPAALLRLMFHDCQVQGCDASILVDPCDPAEPSEMDSSKNFGIRKREAIGVIKSMVEAVCPLQVSCADIIILAAREAVAVAGGPRIAVPLGRRDSTTPPSSQLADTWLPTSNTGVDDMLKIFGQKGMTTEEAVAIMGAHTLGVTHCGSIKGRLDSQEGAGPMGPGLELMLRLSCPFGPLTPNTSFLPNDPTTLVFDNLYYTNAMRGMGVLTIDAELPFDHRTAPFVRRFAADPAQFFRVFASAFVKLSSYGVLTGGEGVVREICHVRS
ncbi:Peroxidase [Bertholletia excelsa]